MGSFRFIGAALDNRSLASRWLMRTVHWGRALIGLGCVTTSAWGQGAFSASYAFFPTAFAGGGSTTASSASYSAIGTFEPGFMGDAVSPQYVSGHGYVQELVTVVSSVLGRHLFYNHSAWDGATASAAASDDQAIASDKAPLVSGRATFANYSSYSLGLNGVMVDIASLPAAGVTAADFDLRVGNNDTPGSWTPAPAPDSITIRRGAGVGNSDRITLIWSDAVAPKKTWLRVEVRATPATGLARSSIAYFGNAIGETGNDAGNARVTTTDELLARANPASVLSPASLVNLYDFNRDQRVSTVDQLLARENQTSVLSELRLITVTDGTVDGL